MKLLDVVALLDDTPEKVLQRGQAGTIVGTMAPEVFEVEFCELEEQTYALATLSEGWLMVLRDEPASAAV